MFLICALLSVMFQNRLLRISGLPGPLKGKSGDAPTITKLESYRIVKTGDSPEFVCEAGVRSPSLDVTWWKEDRRIRNGGASRSYKVKHVVKTKKVQLSLKIIAVAGTHQGTYTCIARNKNGEYNESFFLSVKRDDLIPGQIKKKISLEGKNVSLECDCKQKECRDNSATSYWRKKESQDISIPSKKFKSSMRQSSIGVIFHLTIVNVSVADKGTYLCGINTSLGFDTKERTLVVLTKDNTPQANPTKQIIFVESQSTATLQCNVTYPVPLQDPATSWALNGSVINTYLPHYADVKDGPVLLGKIQLIILKLLIHNTTVGDVGQYTCGSNFTTGFLHASITLRLKEKTKINQPPNSDSTSVLVAVLSYSVGGASLGLVVSLIAYRFYRNKRNLEDLFNASSINGQNYVYDVFVTFSSKDFAWVRTELLPLIEKNQLRYCIHNRDFMIGKTVADNMANSVYSSRKVLAVMSANYLSSKFCRGALELAVYRSTELGDSSVIVVRIDATDSSKFPKPLRNRTFLDYYDFSERKTWKERLIKHLKPPVNKCLQEKTLVNIT